MLFTSASSLSVALTALTAFGPLGVYAGGNSTEFLPTGGYAVCYNATRSSGFNIGSSSGAPFCATQFNISTHDYHYIDGIKTWSDTAKIRGLEISFTNNKFTRIGITDDSVLAKQELDLNPADTFLVNVTGYDWDYRGPPQNMDGMGILLSNGMELSAGNVTGLEPHTSSPFTLLAGISGKYGANGLEFITFHEVQTAPRPSTRPSNGTVFNWPYVLLPLHTYLF
jgi:hypothetical protein